jgi:hypothetical protein
MISGLTLFMGPTNITDFSSSPQQEFEYLGVSKIEKIEETKQVINIQSSVKIFLEGKGESSSKGRKKSSSKGRVNLPRREGKNLPRREG